MSQSAARLKRADDQTVPVDYDRVVDFLKTLKSHGKVAWQRLQAVRAIEFYARSVREIALPELADIRRKLGEMAEQERTSGRSGIVTQDLIDYAADRRFFCDD
ncbi:MAG: hypothetical protein JSS49_15185 [Planctomycetes bacterium]|nr:hypothetical protein [Planctomycetota bacterium]